MSRVTLALIGLTAASVLLSGCSSPSASTVQWQADGMPRYKHPTQEWWSYQFVYHPYAQVYFQPYTRMYYWNEDGEWYAGPKLPAHITINPDFAQVVYLKSPVPTAQHITVVATAGPAFGSHGNTSWATAEPGYMMSRVDESSE